MRSFIQFFSGFALILSVISCTSPIKKAPVKKDVVKTSVVVMPDSVKPKAEFKLDEPVDLSFSNFENVLKTARLLSDGEAFALGLDTVYWENYLAKNLGNVEGHELKLVFSVIETQQLGYLVYVKAGKVRRKIECYADDQVESFRLISSRIDRDLTLQIEKESALEGECAYMELKQDLKSVNSKAVVIKKKCAQPQSRE